LALPEHGGSRLPERSLAFRDGGEEMTKRPSVTLIGLSLTAILLVGGTADVLIHVWSTSPIPRGTAPAPITGHADTTYGQPIAQARQLLAPLRGRYPGISVAVGVDGRLAWSEALGYADIARRIRTAPKTQFRAYSVAKPLTGTALLRLRQDGMIDLDAPVGRYVTGLPTALAAVTVRQLAGHLSGLRDYRRGEWLPLSSRPCATPQEALGAFVHDALINAPGEAYSYSSFNYVLLSAVIEAVSGQPFAAYVRQTVLEPAGMSATMFGDVRETGSPVSTFYEPTWLGRVRVARFVDNSCKFGAGDLVTTAPDLVRFGNALLAGRLLNAANVELAFSAMQTTAGEETGYGIGWGVGADSGGTRYMSHSGGAIGGRAALLLYPDAHVVVAILANIEGDRLTGVAHKIGMAFVSVQPR
jgi:serine beta-lactamase-like protein LACTB, mitochondrial